MPLPPDVRPRFLALVASVVAIVVLLVLSSVSGGSGEPRDILDGEPRAPDDEGIATELSFESITLDDERTYRISPDLIAFSPYTLELEPMLQRNGQYVQIGLKGDTMVWMAGISAAVPTPEGRLLAYYTGILEKVAGGRAQFRDGTILRVEGEVETPPLPQLVQVAIDAERHVIASVLTATGPAQDDADASNSGGTPEVTAEAPTTIGGDGATTTAPSGSSTKERVP